MMGQANDISKYTFEILFSLRQRRIMFTSRPWRRAKNSQS